MPYALRMSEDQPARGVRELIGERGEQLLGRLARDLLDSPMLGAALGRVLDARSRATQAQEAAIGMLGVPSAGDVERLTRRVRSLSDRVGGIEDSLARIEGAMRRHADQLAQRLDSIERELTSVRRALGDLEAAQLDPPLAVSRDQERLLAGGGG
jgi:hypothetical protein